MKRLIDTFGRRGFDTSRLKFALRTALGCIGAVWVAWIAGLEHPQWAGMTVWIASQPMRGHLIEKSIFRIAGTISGSIVGVGLMAFSKGDPLFLTLGLSAWIALCTGIGNLQRGYVSYGTILAGYSAAMVSLLGSEHPTNIFGVGIDRLLTVSVGVTVALFASWSFADHSSGDLLTTQIRTLAARVLRLLSARLLKPNSEIDTDWHELLKGISALDDSLDSHGAGSLRSRRAVRDIRTLLGTQISILLWLKGTHEAAVSEYLFDNLLQAIDLLESDGSPSEIQALLIHKDCQIPLRVMLSDLSDGVGRSLSPEFAAKPKATVGASASSHLIVLHRDWIGAKEAMIRAGTAVFLVGILWWVTGWQSIVYMLLGTTVMMTLFSSLENPSRTLRTVFVGQLLGVLGALACRWVAWPHATSQAQLIGYLIPFIFLGALFYSHRLTVAFSFDYNMVMLLLLQPSFPLRGDFLQSINVYTAVLLAPIFALVAYKIIFPTNATRRRDALIEMMILELKAMAFDARALERRNVWRARLNHRLLRLITWNEKTGSGNLFPIEGALVVLSLGNVIFRAHELIQESNVTPRVLRGLRALLKRLHQIEMDPQRTLHTLIRNANLINTYSPADAPLFAEAIHHLSEHPDFFERRPAG